MNRLKERRLELGMTQEAVSGILKLADPRMDVSMVSRFENGACLPTEEVMTALAAALHTTDRKMRKAVSEAKKQGLMICNDGDGYYQSDELSDLWRQYRRETARAMSILKARKPMREVLKAAGRPV